MHESLGTHYQSYTTTSENAHKFSHTSSVGVIEISQSIWMHPLQSLHHIQFILYIFRTFSTETHGNVIFPHKVRKTITARIKKELTDFLMSFSRLTNDQTDLKFLNQKYIS